MPTATMTALNLKSVAAVLATMVAGTGTYLVQQRKANRLRNENLRQIAVQSELLTERDSARIAARVRDDELQRLQRDQGELLRLRGEIVRLRQQLEARKVSPLPLTKPTPEAEQNAVHAPGTYIAKDQLSNAGYATPEAALETYFWAVTKGTFEQATESMSPEKLAEIMKNSNREQLEAELKRDSSSFKGIQMMARKVVADHEVELKFKMDLDPVLRKTNPDLPEEFVQPMHKIGEQWKMGADARPNDKAWEDDPLVRRFTP